MGAEHVPGSVLTADEVVSYYSAHGLGIDRRTVKSKVEKFLSAATVPR